MERVAVFIDGSNFYNALPASSGPRGGSTLGRLSVRETVCPGCGRKSPRYVEKGVDMRIGVDMLSLASRGQLDVAVLVSGDGDLAEAVKAVKDLGKHVELATLPRGCSRELIQAADVVRDIRTADMVPFYLRSS